MFNLYSKKKKKKKAEEILNNQFCFNLKHLKP